MVSVMRSVGDRVFAGNGRPFQPSAYKEPPDMALPGEAGSFGVRSIGFRTYADDSPREYDDAQADDSTGELQTEPPWLPEAPCELDGTNAAEPADRPANDDQQRGRRAHRWIAIAGAAAGLLGVGAAAGAGLTWFALATRAAPSNAVRHPDVGPFPVATVPSEPALRPEIQPEKPRSTASTHRRTRAPHRTHIARKKAAAARRPEHLERDVPPADPDVADAAARPLLPGLEERLAAARSGR
jgi:hypothetical protein